MDKAFIEERARKIRACTMHTIGTLGVGHVGGSLSIADVLAVLYFDKMNVDPKNKDMAGRDRFVLSKGHAGPALYATLALKGYFPMSWLDTLNTSNTNLPSHCDMILTPGVDMTAGSLGQGFSCAVGIAKAAKNAGGTETIYSIIGDGESQEGIIWEAAFSAAHFGLSNLIVFVDNNKFQLDGATADIMEVGSFVDKFKAFGFDAVEIDGHDVTAISEAIDAAKKTNKPSAIVLNTVKGQGVQFVIDAGAGNHSMAVSRVQMETSILELGGID